MRKTFPILVLVFFFTSCEPELQKSGIEYGKEIFFAGYDALLSDDQLKLFDNGKFKISLSNYEANGTYKIKGDTLILIYFIKNNILPEAYEFKSHKNYINTIDIHHVIGEEKRKVDAGLMIYRNDLIN